jgi:beta-lactamase superfamily II metal-dependent hydrolase
MIDISIDMLAVNNADAIIVWLKDEDNNNFVILIDGGNKKDGEKVINHLDKYILKQAGKLAPDLIICSHHDKDHIGGLITVVEHYGNLIDEVWINNPAEFLGALNYRHLEESFRLKSQYKQYQVILESLTNLDDFISLVNRKKIPCNNALAGQSKHSGIVTILGPSYSFYKALLPGMENMDKFVTEEAGWAYNSIFGVAAINESLENSSPCPIVDEENTTSATNNSSVILEIKAKGKRYLFTGDAGVKALEDVETRTSLENIYWIDVPHHGSRRNLSSRLIDTMKPTTCYISAEGSTKHPRRALVNCLKKHGANVYCTKNGNDLWHHMGEFPSREEYTNASSL